MNWILIVTGFIFLISVIVGMSKGAIRIAVSLAATIATFVLVVLLTPYVSDGIAAATPLDEMIAEQAEESIGGMAASILQGEAEESGLTVESVRRVLEAAGIAEAQLQAAGITVEDIVNGNVTDEQLSQAGISSSVLDGLRQGNAEAAEILEGEEIPREIQISAIEGADFPKIFKDILLDNNNSEMYEELGAGTFAQYIAKSVAKLILNVLSFVVVFVIVTIVVRAVVFALDIVANLPVLGFFNRLAGGVLGAVGALIIVWFLFTAVTLLYTTTFGREAYQAIQGNDILKMIYEINPVMKAVVSLK